MNKYNNQLNSKHHYNSIFKHYQDSATSSPSKNSSQTYKAQLIISKNRERQKKMDLERQQNIKMVERLYNIETKYQKSSQQIEKTSLMNLFRSRTHKKSRSQASASNMKLRDVQKIESQIQSVDKYCKQLDTEHQIKNKDQNENEADLSKGHNRHKSIDFNLQSPKIENIYGLPYLGLNRESPPPKKQSVSFNSLPAVKNEHFNSESIEKILILQKFSQ